MIDKLVVVAIGGNSLIPDPRNPHIDEQWEAVRETCRHIADMIADGWQVIITHGNGPQVGYIMQRSEIAMREAGIHDVPLDLVVADTQGSIGYMLQQALDNSLRRVGMNHTVAPSSPNRVIRSRASTIPTSIGLMTGATKKPRPKAGRS